MTARDHEDGPDPAPGEVLRLVALCQQRWAAWASADDPEQRRALREAHKAALQQLWEALEPSLRRVAYTWLRSNLAPDVSSLTQSMFSYILETLPRLRLDPEKNPVSYLMTIAWRGCYDEYGRHYDVRRVRRRGAAPRDDEGAEQQARLRFNEELPIQLADGDGDVAERVVDQIADEAVIQAVRAYWATLPIDTGRIMEWRSFVDPPRAFREIAADLGPGWTEAAARKRYSRVMEATRDELRRRGLLGSNHP